LFGGTDGLDFYRRLLPYASQYLKPGGCIVLEIGISQFGSILSMLRGGRLELVDTTHDLQGIARTLCIRRIV
jgi:release factor glutamine methyltransferase